MDVIETVLEKTQFMSYHPQLSSNLTLIHVMLYGLMRRQFDYGVESGNQYISSVNEDTIEDVRCVADTLRCYKTKLAAAFARIRVNRRASGVNLEEQFSKLLTNDLRERESTAGKLKWRPH
jgi:hypothetical protein